MTPRYIVRGQPVSQEKVRLAKKHRQNLTEAERVLWQHLRGNRLEGKHIRRQQDIISPPLLEEGPGERS